MVLFKRFINANNLLIKMKEKIVSFFYENPREKLNLKTISKKTNISHMSALRAVNELVNQGFLNIKKTKLESIVTLNIEKTKELRRLYNIKKIIESGLVEYLEKLFEYPKAIVLFGSYSFGEDNGTGDIDIAVQTKLKKNPNLKLFEKKLNRQIEIFTFDEKTKDELKKSICNGFVLRGRIQ